jgi:hypothetical protein
MLYKFTIEIESDSTIHFSSETLAPTTKYKERGGTTHTWHVMQKCLHFNSYGHGVVVLLYYYKKQMPIPTEILY